MSGGEHRGHAVALLDAVGERRPQRLRARPRASALSAVARRRCSGVRRSWATLSSEPLIPARSDSMRSSISLASRPRSSRASPSPRTATRAETWPVRTMPSRTAVSRRRGRRADRVARAAPPSASSTTAAKARAAPARKRARMSARASELLPTSKSVPSGRRADATSKPSGLPGAGDAGEHGLARGAGDAHHQALRAAGQPIAWPPPR